MGWTTPQSNPLQPEGRAKRPAFFFALKNCAQLVVTARPV
jgi:hypothetical protein